MAIPYISIFTPTYNRGAYLSLLYASIKNQDFGSFEWIIVDDGSTDGTQEKVNGFISEGLVPIGYHFQQNAGKHIAINKGVKMAAGELFFIVDSDDTLTKHALSTIVEQWRAVLKRTDSARFAGVCGLRIYKDGTVIGGDVDYEILDASALEYRFKMEYKGDKAEVISTRIMAQYPYPVISDESFCADALVWNRIAKSYMLRFFNEGIYICEYLPGGITDTSVRLRKSSPKYACLYYAEMSNMPGLSFMQKFKAVINFWRFAVYDQGAGLSKKMKQINMSWSVILWPVSRLFMLFDKYINPQKGK
ncbi:glycosyltransferase family 2 protein [Parapedobacter tibetensis]|uniref:glycosyltransferase family 2 protein n=1 Tax=Parapedobacter tibetensis TaxID=2972951 RepID=UPI00214DE8E3|nr:glycosyltransferase family A protein [Parapedobacter tibetensis]